MFGSRTFGVSVGYSFIQETRKLSNAADDIETAKENPIVSNGTLKQ